MRALVWRYVAAMHRRLDDSPVTDDDINEVKNDISTMRFEMLEIFQKSGMDCSGVDRREKSRLIHITVQFYYYNIFQFFIYSCISKEDESLGTSLDERLPCCSD